MPSPSDAMTPGSTFWSGRLVCLTGGTGFLGFHLARTLSELGALVRVFALPVPADHPIRRLRNVELVVGDIRDTAAVRQAVTDCSIVFHAAGPVATWGPTMGLLEHIHVDGTRNVLAALAPEARFVHTSSVTAVGASRRPDVLDENSRFNLESCGLPYVRAKRAAENHVLAAANEYDVIVVNPGYLIGPEDYGPSIMGQFCHRFWRGRIPLAPPGGLNLVDVRDVAIGHLLAAEKGERGQRYILGGENRDYPSFMQVLAEAAGFRPRTLPRLPQPLFALLACLSELRGWMRDREPFPSWAHVRLNRYFWFYSSGRARVELGYSPRPLQDTLRDTYAWFKTRTDFRVRGVNRWLLRPADDSVPA